MRRERAALSASILAYFAFFGVGHAAEEDSSARSKEMLRRTQEALRQSQSDNADLSRAKAEAEQKLRAVSQQLEAAQTGSKATQASLGAKLSAAETTQAESLRKLHDITEQLQAATSKLSETAKELAARNNELTAARQSLESSVAANASCEAKNLTLYGYAEEVLQKYKTKGVWASLTQKEPMFGLKEVDVENVVQEYQLKFDSQKAKP